jgi:hypothetical protein
MKKTATAFCIIQLFLSFLWFLRNADPNFRVFGGEFYLGILSAVLIATPTLSVLALRQEGSTKQDS